MSNSEDPRTSFNLFEKQEESKRRLNEILQSDDGSFEVVSSATTTTTTKTQRQDSLDVIHHDNTTTTPSKIKNDDNNPFKVVFESILGVTTTSNDEKKKENDKKGIEQVIATAKNFVATTTSSSSRSTNSEKEDWEMIENELKLVANQFKSSFSHLIPYEFNPLALGYYLEEQDSNKNPSWKRRQHRFLQPLDISTIYTLHDALYLAELSYCDSINDITKGIASSYEGDPYELIYCTIEAQPRQPAHFLCLKKEGKKKENNGGGGFLSPLLQSFTEPEPLEILLVIRGTKEVSDVLSDALLESRPYGEGMAHDGICQSGEWIVQKHLPLFQHLLKESERTKIKLQLIGHSLGAGTAAIACLEFNKQSDIKIDATCIGFGCPALLTKELAEGCSDKITTVISDSDCVPRMSKVTVSNLLLDVMSYDFTSSAIRDVEQLMMVLGKNVPFDFPKSKQDDVVNWVKEHCVSSLIPNNNNDKNDDKDESNNTEQKKVVSIPKDRPPPELMPPGKCIHLYRDGYGISATYVPNDFFNELDLCLTMVDDHYISTGYHRLMLELMRSHLKNTRFDFRHDLLALRVEKKEDGEATTETEATKG